MLFVLPFIIHLQSLCTQVAGSCTLFDDFITGECTNICQDINQCSQPSPPCVFKPIRSAEDFKHYENCTEVVVIMFASDRSCAQVCGLELNNLPEFNPQLFSAFRNLNLVRGQLIITNNKFIYNLDFLSNLYLVCQASALCVWLMWVG